MPFQHTRRPHAPPPKPDTAAWRRIARALTSGEDDATIARRLRAGREHVAHIRAALDATPAPPVAILADDVPAETDTPAPRLVIRANPTITCWNCGRDGTPSESRPMWCKACAASAEAASWRETQLWRCECGRPFARSTREPEHCIKCSGEYDVTTRWQRQGYHRPAAAD